jgi:hypothetical protein
LACINDPSKASSKAGVQQVYDAYQPKAALHGRDIPGVTCPTEAIRLEDGAHLHIVDNGGLLSRCVVTSVDSLNRLPPKEQAEAEAARQCYLDKLDEIASKPDDKR